MNLMSVEETPSPLKTWQERSVRGQQKGGRGRVTKN